MRVYGPYKRKDGRSHVILIDVDGSRRTVSYPKYIMEQHLGRELHPDNETVDHIDGDFTNNDLSNLRITNRSQHARDDAIRVALVKYKCPICNKYFRRNPKDVDHNHKLNKVGPFCGKSCAGKYGAEVQNNRMDILEVCWIKPIRKYYKKNKEV
jgi:hypothetical protein